MESHGEELNSEVGNRQAPADILEPFVYYLYAFPRPRTRRAKYSRNNGVGSLDSASSKYQAETFG